jgi:hypothetical protein
LQLLEIRTPCHVTILNKNAEVNKKYNLCGGSDIILSDKKFGLVFQTCSAE